MKQTRKYLLNTTLSTAVLCSLGAPGAFAQDTTSQSDIDQTGTMNTAVIDQQYLVPGMYGYINQNGDYNEAQMLQVGPVEEAMTAEIGQIGSSNVATTEQREIAYQGSLTIYQSGNNNTATASQVAGYEATGSIEQTGDLNQATLYQADADSFAVVQQTGTANAVSIAQSGIDDAYFQRAIVQQTGNNNTMEVLQDQMGMNSLTATQIGSGNYAEIHQWQTGGISYGISNIEMVVDGQNNMVFAEQAFNSPGSFELDLSGDGNRIELVHGGDGVHTFIASRSSNYNLDIIDQVGVSASIDINRYDTHNSRTNIVQTAFGENIAIEQGYSDNAVVEIQQLSVLQSDILVQQLNSQNVFTSIEQNAWVSQATVGQIGTTASTATIRQYHSTENGNNLIASIYQRGGTDLSSAEIQQTNAYNTALIEQITVSDTSAMVMQTGTAGYAEIIQTAGTNNMASITQAGEGYSASLHQSGSNNMAEIIQM